MKKIAAFIVALGVSLQAMDDQMKLTKLQKAFDQVKQNAPQTPPRRGSLDGVTFSHNCFNEKRRGSDSK